MASLRERSRPWLRRIHPWLGRLGGFGAGFLGGWYGAAAGFVLGAMVDSARATRVLRGYLAAPDRERPRESLPGLTAVAALSLASFWPGPGGEERRRDLLLSCARGAFGPSAFLLRDLSHFLDAAGSETALHFDAFARDLALRGSLAAQSLLATWAWTLARQEGEDLDHGTNDGVVTALADSGCPASAIVAARALVFPGYRDPWSILGVAAGAGPEEVKRAWRSKSRSLHPDVAGGKEAAAFRSAHEAFVFLRQKGS